MKKVSLAIILLLCFNTGFSQWVNDGYGRPRTYDLQHIIIKTSFDESNKTVFGECTITLQPLNNDFRQFELDAISMKIDYVKISTGKELKFEKIYDDQGLKVFLDKAYSKNEKITFTVKYSCQPKSGLYFVQPDSLNPNRRWQIWTQGQGRGNHNWFPNFNYQNDKTTTETVTTVKDNYEVLSNGKLISVTKDKKNKTKTFHWKMSKPHSTYLVMLGIGEYQIIKDKYKNIPVEYYVYKDNLEDAKRCFRLTPDMIKFFSKTTGFEYPWEKYDQILLNNFMYGGMENTTATTLNDTRNVVNKRTELDYQPTSIIAHELAHQWYGDLITAKDGMNHWLQEGFATYFDALYRGNLLGNDEFMRIMDGNMDSYKEDEAEQGKIPMQSKQAPFVYVKGATVLNMLRSVLGDKDFFKSIQLYTKRFAFGLADIEGLTKAIKDAAGKDLTWFFDEWLFKASYPDFNVSYTYDEISKNIKLTVKQTQKTDSIIPVFKMPVNVEVTTIKGKKLHKLNIESADQTFNIKSDSKPLNVIFDKGNWIVKNISFEKSKEELIYQLKNAEYGYDRKIAAEGLTKFAADQNVFNALSESGIKDKFWWVRMQSADSAVAVSNPKSKELYVKMLKDPKSAVRASAAKSISFFKDADIAALLRDRIQNDSSYVVVGNSVISLAKVEGEKALDIIIHAAKMESFRDMVKISSIMALKLIDTPKSIQALIELTKIGENFMVRDRALSALVKCKTDTDKIKQTINSLSNDIDKRISKKAKEIIEKI